MSIKSIAYVLGWILKIEGAFMALPIAMAILYGEMEGWAYVMTGALCMLCGTLLTGRRPRNPSFYAKEGFVATALSWIVMSVFGCLPFMMTGEIPHFVDALFETVSGFTTTGASIMPEVESMSRASMSWRCFTHWIGGMGVLVFLLAVLPMTGGTNMQLMKAESPGPSVGKLVPKVRYTAQILYRLYIVLTVVMFLLLLAGRMDPFEAMCTSFGTAGTGGFGVLNDSMASYSPYLQWVVTIFMILFGVNFNVYFLIFMRRIGQALRCEEMRWYLLIIAAATGMIFLNIYDAASMGVGDTLRHSAFQVASIITTTGYATTDFNLWPAFSRGILVLLMFIGACAGSTGGGLKVSRYVIAAKMMARYLSKFLHPRQVRRVKFEGKDVDAETMNAICIYFMGAFAIFTASVLVVSLENKDLVTTFSAVATTFNNVGPGLGLAGPTSNFGHFTALSKAVMTFDMLCGRLEIFPILMLLYPAMWKEALGESARRRRQAKEREAAGRA